MNPGQRSLRSIQSDGGTLLKVKTEPEPGDLCSGEMSPHSESDPELSRSPSPPPPPGRPWKCVECRDYFNTELNLKKHSHRHGYGFRCSVSHCPAEFGINAFLLHHMKRMHADVVQNQFRCASCDLPFRTKTQLGDHEKAVCRVRAWAKVTKCDECGESFGYITSHKKTHGPGFKCYDCGAEYRVAHSLESHRIRVHGADKRVRKHETKNFSCKYCADVFRNNILLEGHERSHWTGRGAIYPCPSCGTRFKSSKALALHKARTHSKTAAQGSRLRLSSEEEEDDDQEDTMAKESKDPLAMDLEGQNIRCLPHNHEFQVPILDEITMGGELCPIKREQFPTSETDNCENNYNIQASQQDIKPSFSNMGDITVKIEQAFDDNLFL